MPPFSKATFPSLTACLYLLDARDREWCLRLASKYNFGLLWPWPLTSGPPRSTGHVFAPGEDLCQFALNSVHSFSKYIAFTSWSNRAPFLTPHVVIPKDIATERGEYTSGTQLYRLANFHADRPDHRICPHRNKNIVIASAAHTICRGHLS